MLAIILMLITTIISSAVVGFINNKFNISIQGFAIFWVVPVGAILVGSLAASGLWLSRKLQNTPLKTWFLVAGAVAGLLSFFGSLYVDFKIADYQLRTESKAVIDRLSDEDKKKLDQELTFFNFVKRTHNDSQINLSHNGHKVTTIDNQWISIASFWAAVLGAVFGGWFVANMVIGERTKDKRTGEYRDLKYLALLEVDKYPELVELTKKSKNLGKDIAKFLTDNPTKKELASKAHTIVKILKSRAKGDGQVAAVLLKQDSNKIVADGNFEHDLTEAEMAEIMSAVLSINPKEKF